MFTFNKARKVAATLAASALLLGTIAVATPAAGASNGNLDPTATGSITIHKRTHNSSTNVAKPDGSVQAPGSPVAGVSFRVTRVPGIDLLTTAGWDQFDAVAKGVTVISRDAANITVGSVTTPIAAGTEWTKVTSGNAADKGQATFSIPNALGAYLVEEIAAPASVVERAAPFVVALPTSFADTTVSGGNPTKKPAVWLYNVNVYPKNVVSSITKTVSAPSKTIANTTVDFPVTVTVPTIGKEKFTHFAVVDNNAGDFDYMSVSSVTLDGEAMSASNDFTYDAGIVSFRIAGLAELDAAQEKDLVVTFQAGIRTKIGALSNTASASFASADASISGNGTHVPPEPLTTTKIPTTPPVQTNWGSFTATKVDAADTTKTLAGAEFSLFPGSAKADGTCEAPAVAPTTGALETITTMADGLIKFGPLFVSDSNTNNAPFSCYVLVETKAPVGFDIVTKPIALTIYANANNTAGVDGKILNPKSSVSGDISLPMTGAAGQVLMTLGGIALLAIALGMVIVRRKQAAEATS